MKKHLIITTVALIVFSFACAGLEKLSGRRLQARSQRYASMRGWNRLLARAAAAPQAKAQRALRLAFGGIFIFGALYPTILSLRLPLPQMIFPLLALLGGALTGLTYPLAVALASGEPARAAGMLYGADLLGGCLGALLGSAILVPVLGIPQTCMVVAMLGLAGWLALAN